MAARIDAKSEAQSAAEAISRRVSRYASENAESALRANSPRDFEPKSLDGLVKEVRRAYGLEAPDGVHRADVAPDGSPEFSRAFERWIFGEDRGPLRDALRGMARSSDERTRRRGRIASRIALGMSAGDSVTAERGNPLDAEPVACDALRVAWRRMVSTPIAGRRQIA